jgi:hypothetical protein
MLSGIYFLLFGVFVPLNMPLMCFHVQVIMSELGKQNRPETMILSVHT